MSEGQTGSPDSIQSNTFTPAAIIVSVLAIALMAWLRLWAISDRLPPIGYGVLLCAFLLLRDRRVLWITAAAFAAITYFEIYYTLPHHDPNNLWKGAYGIAFGLNVFDLFLITLIIHLLITSRNKLHRNNASLEKSNASLAAREEEIARKNEQLQSQTTGLERQSEELRVANEGLIQHERMLQTLLELSRSLNLGLSVDDALGRICQTLSHLVNSGNAATAILLAEDNSLKVRCDHGFGPAGIRSRQIPRDKSFSAHVIKEARTDFRENLSLQPELFVLQPKDGEPMVSVLATPLRVRGQVIGTIEIYSREPRHWGKEQIGLIESLAAQASTSMENAELFDEIERARRRLAAIVENVPTGLAIADAKLTDIRLNTAASAMLGTAPDVNIAADLAHMSVSFFEDGKLLPRDRYPLQRAIAGERVYPHELEIELPDKRRLITLSSAVPIYGSHGQVIGAVTSLVDISMLKQLQRELEARRREAEEANIRKTRFLAAASHDIRTPANAISLLAELLKRTADSPSMASEIPQLAEELRNSANALITLVSNVLDVTRFDTDKLDLHESEFPLAQLMDEESRQVLPLAQAKSLVLEVQQAQAAIWLRADRIKLGRVLGNLLGNAIKFTDQGKIRLVSARAPDGAVTISVSDTGVGISAENQSRIFDEFWQLSDPDRSKGSGLGLSICKRLMDAMGGQITVQSIEGQGSTFTLTMPATCVVSRAGDT